MGILSSPPKNKKPKLEICEFKYCTLTRDHQLSECNYLNRNKCAANHQKLKGIPKRHSKSNQYLKYALRKSMELRFAQEKLQKAQDNLYKQLVKNSEHFHKINPYNSVPNLSQYEMEQEERNDCNQKHEQIVYGTDYAPHTTVSPPGFKKLSTPLSEDTKKSEVQHSKQYDTLDLKDMKNTIQYDTLDLKTIKNTISYDTLDLKAMKNTILYCILTS